MYRALKGTGNNYMDRFELELKKQVHKQRIRVARENGNDELTNTIYDPNVFILGTAQMDNFASTHKRNYAKTIQLKEERCTEIERENRILLEKMSNIMQNPKPNLYNPNNEYKKSLNREQRRRDLIKITVEN